jgi:hypothetical protein
MIGITAKDSGKETKERAGHFFWLLSKLLALIDLI